MPVEESTLTAEQAAYGEVSASTINAYSSVTLPSGCVIMYATRGPDSRPVWIDAACGRATTAEFAEQGYPFIDEAVAAWHEGEEITSQGDFEKELVKAGALVIATRAGLENVKVAVFATVSSREEAVAGARRRWYGAIERRTEAIIRAHLVGCWSVREIAAAAQMQRSVVHNITKKVPRA